jgi:HlyD family secretion protein
MTKKKIIYATLGIIVILAVSLALLRGGEQKETISYLTEDVTPGSISLTVTATGTVEPVKQVEVGTQVSGVIKKIYVDFNSSVKSGQLLAELDKTPLLAQLASVEADLQSAQSQFVFQEANFKRMEQLLAKKAISQTDYESALYQYSAAKANVAKMKSEVERARTNLGYAMIYSPIDGVVLNRAVDEGQTVAASFNTPTLFTIAQDLTKMQVVANVDEADIGKVKEGEKVTFTVDAYPDDTFTGSVKQVRLLAVTNSNVVTYSVVIDAPNPELKLKPGLTASITAYTSSAENVLTIPSKALRFKPDTLPAEPGVSRVWVMEQGKIRPVTVVAGITDETHTEIKSGLSAGQKVIIGTSTISAASGQAESTSSQSPFMPKRPASKK